MEMTKPEVIVTASSQFIVPIHLPTHGIGIKNCFNSDGFPVRGNNFLENKLIIISSIIVPTDSEQMIAMKNSK